MNRVVLFVSLVIAVCMSSCGGTGSSEQTKLENDSLRIQLSEAQRLNNELSTAFNSIDENLQSIKEKEKSIGISVGSSDNPVTKTERVNNDINAIYDLMLENKKQVARLKAEARKANGNNKSLNETIERLEKQLSDKTIEIIKLQKLLEDKDIQIASLNFTVEGLEGVIDSLEVDRQKTQAELNKATTEANTVYYAFGSKKELKDQNIITNDGILGKKKLLVEDFNSNFFTSADKRELTEIDLLSKNVKILSNHPKGSYELVDAGDGPKTLVIKDVDSFWSVSNYFVAQVN